MSPTVSIIIPTYNHAHYLPRAVDSVLNQSFQDYEVIIVDDGSVDNTQEIAMSFTDARIDYIYQKNCGLAGARNTGLRAATGEFIALLDADDIFLPRKLEEQVGWFFDHKDFGFNAGGWNYIDQDDRLIGEYKPWLYPYDLSVQGWLFNCHVNPVSVLVRKWWIERVGGFDEDLRQVEDWDMWLRLAYAGCKMGLVHEVVGGYRFSTGQMTRNAAEQKKSIMQMMNKFYSQTELPSELEKLKADVYTCAYLISAGREYGVGQIDDAKESIDKAIEHNPDLSTHWDQKELQELFGWEDTLYCQTTSIEYRGVLLANLPDTANALRQKKAMMMGEAGLKTFYKAYQNHDWQLVRRAALVTARYSPRCMLNRGYWSIIYQSILNLKISHPSAWFLYLLSGYILLY